jgi:phosphatidate cytidylyltransferase
MILLHEFVTRIKTASALLAVLFLCFYLPPFITNVLLIGILTYIVLVEWPRLVPSCSITFWLITPLYPTIPFLTLMALNSSIVYRSLLFKMILLVASYDTGAYVVGSAYGKHKLAPTLSPQKTWEGCLGGYAAACVMYLCIQLITNASVTYVLFFNTGLICCSAQLGDLLESAFKRHAHIKHSGSLLPGHGGLLDRFDSLITAGMLMWYARDYFLYS